MGIPHVKRTHADPRRSNAFGDNPIFVVTSLFTPCSTLIAFDCFRRVAADADNCAIAFPQSGAFIAYFTAQRNACLRALR